jgi:tetratricopeptide (TPR) repeat protein
MTVDGTEAEPADRGVDARCRLALTLAEQGDLTDALARAAEATELAPAHGPAYAAAAMIASRMGKSDQEAAWLERGLAAVPDDPALLTAEANRLLDFGRIDEAERAFDRALRAKPDHPPALFGRASIAGFRKQPLDPAPLEDLLARAQSTEDRFHLHFALGQAYLERDEPDHAFRHFASGNALRRAAYTYDVADDQRLMASIADAYSAGAIERLAGLGAPGETAIFIVGMPRSGTSLLEQILSAHPAIHGAGELLHVKHLVMRDLGAFPAVDLLTADRLRALGRRYTETTAALAPDAARIVDKLPLNFLFAGLIHLMLPNARIIHIRRDPLDTCLSCHTTLFRTPMRFVHDQTELGRFHRAYRRLMAHWRQALPAGRFIEVDYGVLATAPEPEIRRLLDFCGMPWSDACLYPETSDRAIRTASRLQARRPIHRGSIGRAERYRAYLGPLIAALGAED